MPKTSYKTPPRALVRTPKAPVLKRRALVRKPKASRRSVTTTPPRRLESGAWLMPSDGGSKFYLVHVVYARPSAGMCTCLSYQFETGLKNGTCKHMRRAHDYERAHQVNQIMASLGPADLTLD